MEARPQPNRWAIGGGAIVLLTIAVPLWNTMREPGHIGWNLFLGAVLLGMSALAVSAQIYFSRHPLDVGEARFDTSNKSDEA